MLDLRVKVDRRLQDLRLNPVLDYITAATSLGVCPCKITSQVICGEKLVAP